MRESVGDLEFVLAKGSVRQQENVIYSIAFSRLIIELQKAKTAEEKCRIQRKFDLRWRFLLARDSKPARKRARMSSSTRPASLSQPATKSAQRARVQRKSRP
jgi:hypothetical protein